MAGPAVVAGDRVEGACQAHLVPDPTTGAAVPTPAPLPFAAPLTDGLASSVLVGGRPLAVQGSAGLNTPAHVGLHPTDAFLATPQRATLEGGSATVLAEGRPAAATGAPCRMCTEPGQVRGSATDVLVG